jgi:hypothetical protein
MKNYKGIIKEAYDYALSIGIRYCEAKEIAEELLLGKAENFTDAYVNVGVNWIEWELNQLNENPTDYFISTELGQYIDFGVEAKLISADSWMYQRIKELDAVTFKNSY